MMLGLPRGEVFLVPWTEEWEIEFLSEKEMIEDKFGKHIVVVHHIGSTAVKGLSAKPIIDIAVEIKEFRKGDHCIAPLEDMGYDYKGTKILPERHYFSKGEPRTHQIHMYEHGNKYLLQQLKFRDNLRSDGNTLTKYEELKLQLSQINKSNKHKYAEAKTEFIESILNKEDLEGQ